MESCSLWRLVSWKFIHFNWNVIKEKYLNWKWVGRRNERKWNIVTWCIFFCFLYFSIKSTNLNGLWNYNSKTVSICTPFFGVYYFWVFCYLIEFKFVVCRTRNPNTLFDAFHILFRQNIFNFVILSIMHNRFHLSVRNEHMNTWGFTFKIMKLLDITLP